MFLKKEKKSAKVEKGDTENKRRRRKWFKTRNLTMIKRKENVNYVHVSVLQSFFFSSSASAAWQHPGRASFKIYSSLRSAQAATVSCLSPQTHTQGESRFRSPLCPVSDNSRQCG
ncbi:hypothetical protein ILYODFUR_024173 [Ilyodon furcidens]|uniref:Uncharacterized protein n=1 Tax=Ilyodon furcidens TaxID=33524 RepID=A0ABV0U803_9TELE